MANKEPTKGQQQTTYNPRKDNNKPLIIPVNSITGALVIPQFATLPTPVGSSKIIH